MRSAVGSVMVYFLYFSIFHRILFLRRLSTRKFGMSFSIQVIVCGLLVTKVRDELRLDQLVGWAVLFFQPLHCDIQHNISVDRVSFLAFLLTPDKHQFLLVPISINMIAPQQIIFYLTLPVVFLLHLLIIVACEQLVSQTPRLDALMRKLVTFK